MKVECLIVEDQAPAQRVLERYIAELPHLQLTGVCGNALDAMAFLHRHEVHLMFLDLDLPRLGGFDFLRSLTRRPAVIVTTAYPQHALEGFELAVADYLVKPIPFDRFVRAVDRAISPAPAEPSANAPNDHGRREIFVKIDRDLRRVAHDDIIFIRAEGDYVTIVTSSAQLFAPGPLVRWEQKLPAQQFARTHRSYIVNLSQVSRIAGSTAVTDAGGIPNGRRYRESLLQQVTPAGH